MFAETCSTWSTSNLRKTDCSVSLCGPTGSLGAYPLLSVWTRSKIGCSVLLCGPTGPDQSTGSPRPAEFMSGTPGYTGVFSVLSVISPSKADCSVVFSVPSVISPSKADCSVVLLGPTGPDRSTGSLCPVE